MAASDHLLYGLPGIMPPPLLLHTSEIDFFKRFEDCLRNGLRRNRAGAAPSGNFL